MTPLETLTYRSATLVHERMGHWNVIRTSDGAWVTGAKTLADAKRAVDSRLHPPRVVKVGPNAYRVIPDE